MGAASTHDGQRIHLAICSGPIDLAAIVERVRDQDGTARAVARDRGLCAVATAHRVATVPLPEASVAVAAPALAPLG